MPYLPVDPKDLGRSYEAIIRVNSQSGKGGVTYLLKSEYGLDLPRRMQVEFSRAVQQHTEAGGEVTSEEIRRIFNYEYLPAEDPEKAWGRFQIVGLRTESGNVDGGGSSAERIEVDLIVDGQERTYEGRGNGPIDALVKILVDQFDVDVRLQDYSEHAIGSGADTNAAAYVELAVEDRVVWGAGLHPNITKASLKAVVSAVNRAARDRQN